MAATTRAVNRATPKKSKPTRKIGKCTVNKSGKRDGRKCKATSCTRKRPANKKTCTPCCRTTSLKKAVKSK